MGWYADASGSVFVEEVERLAELGHSLLVRSHLGGWEAGQAGRGRGTWREVQCSGCASVEWRGQGGGWREEDAEVQQVPGRGQTRRCIVCSALQLMMQS